MLLTNSLRFGRGMDVLGGLGWELLFWCAPLAAWAAWRNKFLRAMALFCSAYLLAWFSTGVVLRFLVVLAPLMSLLVGCGLHALWQRLGSRGRALLSSAVALLCLTHVLLFLFIDVGVFGQASVLLGAEDRDAYLSKKLDYYACARVAQDRLPADAKILVAGEQRGYYVEQEHLASTVYGPNKFIRWANEAESPADLADTLSKEGFTALLLAPREMERIGPALGQFTQQGFKNWSGLEPDYAKPIYRTPACVLYGLGTGS
jgi:hypothetical protein